jgi:SAM-dependent methyltransferase
LEKAQKISLITKKGHTAAVKQDIKGQEISADKGFLGHLQTFLKRKGKLYYLLLDLFAPVLSSFACKKATKRLLKKYGQESIVVNIGSGPTYFYNRRDIINVDFYKYDEVDMVADIIDLPIEDAKVDFIINIATLEHIEKANAAVREMFRILKPGGELFCYVPFIVPFHGAPQDFHRWTILGMEKLFSKFEILEIGIGAGPTSGLLWVLQEWAAILLSFGSKTLHDVILLVLLITTMPLKFLDIILVKFPHAEKIASGFYMVAKRKS